MHICVTCLCRHIGTIHDLEAYICASMLKYAEGSPGSIESYESLMMGPITAHPEVQDHFHLQSNKVNICKVIGQVILLSSKQYCDSSCVANAQRNLPSQAAPSAG